MNQINKSAGGPKRRGRKPAPLEVQPEFIQGEAANELWEKIFELLEEEEVEPSHCHQNSSDNPNYNQLKLF